MRRGLADYTATGAELWVPDFLPLLAQAYGWAGCPDAGVELLHEALGRVEASGGRWLQAELHRLTGELLLARSGPASAEAESCFRRAAAIAGEQGARMWELRAVTSLARLWSSQDRRDEACDLLVPACGWFTEGLDEPDLVGARRLADEVGASTRAGAGFESGA